MNKKKYYIKVYNELNEKEKEVVDNYIQTINEKEDFESAEKIQELLSNSNPDTLFKSYVVLGVENPEIGLECMAIASVVPGIDVTNKKFYCNKKDCKKPICGKNLVWIAGYIINKKYKDQGKGYRRDLTAKIINDIIEYNKEKYRNKDFAHVIKNIFSYLPKNPKTKRAINCFKKRGFVINYWDNNYIYFKKQLDIVDSFPKEIEKIFKIIN